MVEFESLPSHEFALARSSGVSALHVFKVGIEGSCLVANSPEHRDNVRGTAATKRHSIPRVPEVSAVTALNFQTGQSRHSSHLPAQRTCYLAFCEIRNIRRETQFCLPPNRTKTAGRALWTGGFGNPSPRTCSVQRVPPWLRHYYVRNTLAHSTDHFHPKLLHAAEVLLYEELRCGWDRAQKIVADFVSFMSLQCVPDYNPGGRYRFPE